MSRRLPSGDVHLTRISLPPDAPNCEPLSPRSADCPSCRERARRSMRTVFGGGLPPRKNSHGQTSSRMSPEKALCGPSRPPLARGGGGRAGKIGAKGRGGGLGGFGPGTFRVARAGGFWSSTAALWTPCVSRLNNTSVRGLVRAMIQLRRIQGAARMILRKTGASGRFSTR